MSSDMKNSAKELKSLLKQASNVVFKFRSTVPKDKEDDAALLEGQINAAQETLASITRQPLTLVKEE